MLTACSWCGKPFECLEPDCCADSHTHAECSEERKAAAHRWQEGDNGLEVCLRCGAIEGAEWRCPGERAN